MDKDDLVSRATDIVENGDADVATGVGRFTADERETILRALESSQSELLEALTPSADTKAAYMGEFSFPVELAHPRLGTEVRHIDVPWTTIKEIMGAIRARAERTSRHG
jgi:hypothetical protein